ncbi:uncharacterized protein LOC119448274 [Dermacentor silvarum]|uniref:uncharacterized protein LOC119448274 n=1 Tax=Dermacentor silvarum TaxID=543639 RepID=UPI0021012DCF|nr:uncharacterized protein LOC119448274 [Dermacentor silvarum]
MQHFGFLVLFGLFIGTQAVSFEDLLEALNTTEKSWLTKRTYSLQGHSCVYAQKLSLTREHYTFEQGYKQDGKEKKHTLYSNLGNDGSGPWMTVSRTPDGHGLKYYLEYLNKNEECGILKVHLSGQDHYEMHQWDNKVGEGAAQCNNQYMTLLAARTSYNVYSESCKSDAQSK